MGWVIHLFFCKCVICHENKQYTIQYNKLGFSFSFYTQDLTNYLQTFANFHQRWLELTDCNHHCSWTVMKTRDINMDRVFNGFSWSSTLYCKDLDVNRPLGQCTSKLKLLIIWYSFRNLYTVNKLILTAIKFGGLATFWVIIEVFPYIILFNFCPNAKSAKFNSTPNLVDLQYMILTHFVFWSFMNSLWRSFFPNDLLASIDVDKVFLS